MVKIPFLDLTVKDEGLKQELLEAVDRVLTHGRIVLGPEVGQFEERIANYCQQKYAVGVNSGTDALYLALRSLDVGPGDEVITTPMSWISTLNAITLCGATPVFVDVREDLNIDPELLQDAITPKTKVILPVHYTGKLCDINRIMDIANEHGITVVEDAAQSFGANLDGAMAGSFGHVNCFSMNPMKVFNAYGEAGAVVTSRQDLQERLMSLRYSGTVNREDCHYPSLNGRIDTIQAAMLMVSMDHLDDKIVKRRANADFYSQTLGETVGCPREEPGYFDVYYTYTIIAERREQLREYLTSQGIETKIHHPILMPYHTAYQHLPKPHIPVAERQVERILSIPSHENMTSEETGYVAQAIQKFYE
jgi:dTDP-4-amino-4,6-dideoxygalactose transaminase